MTERRRSQEMQALTPARVSAHRPAALLSFESSPPPSQRRAISPVIEICSPCKDGWERHMFPASMSSIDSDSVTIASLERLENNRREGGREGGARLQQDPPSCRKRRDIYPKLLQPREAPSVRL